jgi:lysophospholipase L1-like esterase
MSQFLNSRPATAMSALACIAFAACGGVATQSARPTEHPPASLAASTPAVALPTQSLHVLPSTSVKPSGSGLKLQLVGLGDSMPGALDCSAPCRSFVDVYGELAAEGLGQPVAVTNLATNDGLTTDVLLQRLRTDPIHRQAVAGADLLTLSIGNNDWEGPCYWAGHAACFEAGLATVERNLGLILDEVLALRAGAPTAIRVTTQYDTWIGSSGTPGDWGFPATDAGLAEFHSAFKAALTKYNAMVCRVAVAHGVVCVDLAPVFNGPHLDDDAGDLLGPDHAHPSKAGHELIASTIAGAGFEPLR